MGDRIAQLVLGRIDTPVVEEVQGPEDTIRGTRGFGSTGLKRQSDTSEKKALKGENERTSKKNEVVKNATLKDSSSGRQRTDRNRK